MMVENGTVFSNVVDGLATASVLGQVPWTRALSTSPRGELPRLLWLHQTRADGIGQASRFGDACLRRAYRGADTRLGLVLAELDASGLRDSTAVVVTSDHGRAETDYDTPLSSILDTVDGLDYVQAGFFVYLADGLGSTSKRRPLRTAAAREGCLAILTPCRDASVTSSPR